MKIEELLAALKAADETMEEPINLDELVKDIKEKVDSYQYVYEKLHKAVKNLDEEIKELEAKKKRIAKNLDYFQTRLTQAMLIHETSDLPGNKYRMGLRRSERVVADEINDELAEVYKEYARIKVKKEWDKIALKNAIKSGKVLSFALIETNYNLYFERKDK